MSNGEVKDADRGSHEVWCDTQNNISELCNCIASEYIEKIERHERIVAELKAEIARLELVAMAAAESIKEKYKILDTQKRVIEMLLENWDGPLGMAVIQSKIKAIEKGEA